MTRLYNRQRNFRPSLLMEPRILAAYATMNPADAGALGIIDNDVIEVKAGDACLRVRACISDEIATGAVALPRHMTEAAAPLAICAGAISRVSQAVAAAD